MKRVIFLVKVGPVDDVVFRKLKKHLEWALKNYRLEVEILPNSLPLLKSELNLMRNQYDGNKIHKRLREKLGSQSYYRILGIIDKDIFSGTKNFIFGIADQQQDNKNSLIALISIARLKEKFYRRKEDSGLYELRILKEAVHEIGHTFSLTHCSNLCVMQYSNHLQDTDDKPPTFCNSCVNQLKTFFA